MSFGATGKDTMEGIMESIMELTRELKELQETIGAFHYVEFPDGLESDNPEQEKP